MPSSDPIKSPEEDAEALRQLEPFPEEEETQREHEDEKVKSKAPAQDSSIVSRLPPYLIRIQRYSSYASSVYLLMHITNTSLIPLATRSVPAADKYLLLTRPYYQSVLAEPALVVVPILAHIASGVGLRMYRQYQFSKRYDLKLYSKNERREMSSWPKISATSALGLSLIPLISAHVVVNRLVPLWVDGGSSGVGLGFVAHGFARHPIIALAGYAALVGVGSWHFVKGTAKWLGWSPGQISPDLKTRRRRRLLGVNIVAATLATVWMAGGIGIVGRGGPGKGWIGKGWDGLYRQVPFFGARVGLGA